MITALLTSIIFYILLYDKISGTVLVILSGCLFGVMTAVKIKGHSHGSISEIDTYSYKSPLNQWHTGLKTVFSLFMILFCVWADSMAVSVTVFLSMAGITVIGGKIKYKFYFKLISVPFMFIVLGTVAILFEIGQVPAGYLNIPLGRVYICFTEQGRIKALSLFLRAFASASVMYMLALTTPSDKLISFFRKCRLPEIIIELMYLIYRYIFILYSTYKQMVTASNSRLGNRNIKTLYRSFFGISLNLFFISFKKASDNFNALESRSMGGKLVFLEEEESLIPVHLMYTILYSGAVIMLFIAVAGGK